VLEIGSGWGALAQEATTEFKASVVGVTLSTEQLAYAQQRLHNLGVSTGAGATADLRLQDYRDIADAPFDAICSIEMVEAVGRAYWPQYFQTVSRLLKPGGRACVQSIVISDDLFERYVKGTDFIQQYIFPGGCLPCPREFRQQAQAAGLVVEDECAFGLDYAETLRRWRSAFMARQAEARQLGFDTRFMRIWEFYLAYCEAAFEVGNIDLVQYTLVKPVP
jgi:cyclopropane-fatty-acyl-phospholipid synthase